MSRPLTHRQRLADLRARYADRRTVARQLLDEALALVDSTVIELQAAHDAQLTELARQHGAQLAQAENRLREVEGRATRAQDRVRELEAMRTNLRESRETIDDGVLVKFPNPRTYMRSGDEAKWGRPWVLSELETLCFRLRVGGATDDTEVRTKSDHTEATIPFPEMALTAPEPKPETATTAQPPVRWWKQRAAAAAACVLLGIALQYVVSLLGGGS